MRAASDDAAEAFVSHQTVDGARGGGVSGPAQVADHLAAAIGPLGLADGVPQCIGEMGIVDGASRRWRGLPVAVGTWGDLDALLGEHAADRLDPVVLCTHRINELDDQRRRGSSSLAKKIDADFRIALASLRSRFSRSRSLILCCSADVAPGTWHRSIWACLVHTRSDSAPIPSFGPIAWHAA